MIKFLMLLLVLLASAFLGLAAWRWTDRKADQAMWASLAAHQPPAPGKFDSSMVAALPEPARRFFNFAITDGARLYTVAEISMAGDIGLGNKSAPGYLPMRAEQIIAVPHGFVWKLHAGKRVPLSGSDAAASGCSWSRFWLFGVVPAARAGNNDDHARSSFGRYVAEAVFWTPAALLPGAHVRWEPVDDSTARVIVTYQGMEQAVDLSVDADGRASKIEFLRWSDANPAKVFRLQPFGGYLSDYRQFDGFRLPTRIEAGNFFGTDSYFPFYRIGITAVRFPGTP
jgi:hypothetical protein